AALPALRRRGPAQRHVPAARAAEVRRLCRDQPDRGFGLDRHQLRPLDPRAQYRADRFLDQYRGGARDRAAAAPARPGRPGRGRGSRLVLRAGREAAVYLLNKKRHEIAEVEGRYGVLIEVMIDDNLEGARMSVESHGPPPAERPRLPERAPIVDEDDDDLIED